MHAYKVDKKTFELSITFEGKPIEFSMPPFASYDDADLYGQQFIKNWNAPETKGACYPTRPAEEPINNDNNVREIQLAE